jgi:hypothetical protein
VEQTGEISDKRRGSGVLIRDPDRVQDAGVDTLYTLPFTSPMEIPRELIAMCETQQWEEDLSLI